MSGRLAKSWFFSGRVSLLTRSVLLGAMLGINAWIAITGSAVGSLYYPRPTAILMFVFTLILLVGMWRARDGRRAPGAATNLLLAFVFLAAIVLGVAVG